MSEGEPSPKRQHTSPAWDSLLRGPAVSPLRLSSAPHLGSTPSETVAYDAEADAARIDAAKAHNATASDLLSLLLRIEPARALLAVELLCLRDLCRLGATCSISRKITAKCLAPGGVRGLAVTRADAAAGVQLPVLRRLIRLAPPGSAIELPACVFDLGKGKALGVKKRGLTLRGSATPGATVIRRDVPDKFAVVVEAAGFALANVTVAGASFALKVGSGDTSCADCSFQSSVLAAEGSRLLLERCRVSGAAQNALTAAGVVDVQRCAIERNSKAGVYVGATGKATIGHDSRICKNGGGGIAVLGKAKLRACRITQNKGHGVCAWRCEGADTLARWDFPAAVTWEGEQKLRPGVFPGLVIVESVTLVCEGNSKAGWAARGGAAVENAPQPPLLLP